MTPPSIEQQVTFLYTRDLEKTAHFYDQILGLPLVLDQGSCQIFRVSSDAFLGCCYSPDAPQKPSGIILTLVTGEVDAWHRYLIEQGVTIERPPTLNQTYNIYQCFIRDPNGYLFEIQQFLDPTWPTHRPAPPAP